MPEKIENQSRDMSLALVVFFALAACVLYGTGAGLRSDIGILLPHIAAKTSLAYEKVSFCIAVMQLVFGASQPFFGLLASKKSNRFVLVLGAVLIIAGLFGIRASSSFVPLFVSLGIVFALGAGAVSFGLVFTSAVYFVGSKNAMLVSGMLNAASGMMGFALSPVLSTLLEKGGISLALLAVPFASLVMIPLAFLVTARDKKNEVVSTSSTTTSTGSTNASDDTKESAFSVFRDAFSNRTFRLLVAGFSTCGFHMVIIARVNRQLRLAV